MYGLCDNSTLKWLHWCEYQYPTWKLTICSDQSALRKSLKSLRGVRTEFTDVNLLKLAFSVKIHKELKLPSSLAVQTFCFLFLGRQILDSIAATPGIEELDNDNDEDKVRPQEKNAGLFGNYSQTSPPPLLGTSGQNKSGVILWFFCLFFGWFEGTFFNLKFWELGWPPPPCWEKVPNNPVFFFWVLTLSDCKYLLCSNHSMWKLNWYTSPST